MKIYTIMIIQMVLIILITGCIDIPEKVITGEEIANKYIEKQENLQDYSAIAIITTTQPEKSFTIKMMFKKPNKHKIEYPEPLEKNGIGIVITDGSTGTWTYYPERNFADHFIEPEWKDDWIPTFDVMNYYIIAKDILKKSNISYIGTEKNSDHETYVIEAILETSQNYNIDTDVRKIRLWIDKKSWVIQKLIFYDEQNISIRTVESVDFESNIGIPDNEFVFEPPEGVEIDEGLVYYWPLSGKYPLPFNPEDIVESTPLNDSELISIVFSESWLLENDENKDPQIIKITIPRSQLNLIQTEGHSGFLAPTAIKNDEKVVLFQMPKTMYNFFNKDPLNVTINFPVDYFTYYSNVSELNKDMRNNELRK